MKTLTKVIAVLLLMQSTARAEKPWRFLTLADWHLAEIYVQPDKYPEGIATVADGLKMLKANYGGELVMLPGDSNVGHRDTKQFIKSFHTNRFSGDLGSHRATPNCTVGRSAKAIGS